MGFRLKSFIFDILKKMPKDAGVIEYGGAVIKAEL